MKAWLRAAMAALLVGGVVYLVWEEKHRRYTQTTNVAFERNILEKIKAEIAQARSQNDATESVDIIKARTANTVANIDEAMERLDRMMQHAMDAHDDTMVALEMRDKAFDPLSAEFRLAIEKRRKSSK